MNKIDDGRLNHLFIHGEEKVLGSVLETVNAKLRVQALDHIW